MINSGAKAPKSSCPRKTRKLRKKGLLQNRYALKFVMSPRPVGEGQGEGEYHGKPLILPFGVITLSVKMWDLRWEWFMENLMFSKKNHMSTKKHENYEKIELYVSGLVIIYSNLEPRTSNLEPRTSNLEPRTSNLEPRT